jgi:glucose dehydrogenase
MWRPNSGHSFLTENGARLLLHSTGARAFSVNAQTGALTSVPMSPAITLANVTGMYAEPAGQYMYISTGAKNVAGAVFAYSISSSGNLTAVSTLPVATPILPSSMAFRDDIR